MTYGPAFLDAIYIGLMDPQTRRLTQRAMLVSSDHNLDLLKFYKKSGKGCSSLFV